MGDLKELHSAAREGRLEDLKILLTKGGIDLESTDENGETLLYSACKAGHADVVQQLLEAGAQITGSSIGNLTDGDRRYDPVMNAACYSGHTDVVKVLLAKGASLNVADESGNGPLHAACLSNKAGDGMVCLLLENGADPDDRNEDGLTPIFFTIPSIGDEGRLDRMKILIDSGACVNVSEYQYLGRNTPLHNAVFRSHANAARILLEHGADVHALNKRRETPLQVQYYLPPPEVIMLLLDYDGGLAPCRKKECGCGQTVMLCCYNYGLRLNSGAGFAGLFGMDFRKQLAAFQMYWGKMKAAGLMPLESDEKGIVETYDFWRACKAELDRMKIDKVGDTNVTYKDIWYQRQAALRQVEILSLEDIRKFPIYGMLIRRRYVMGRRKLPLMDKAQHFFSLLPLPALLSECIDIILDFLSEDDLQNIADIVASRTKGKNRRPNDLDVPLQVTKVPKMDQD